tara:strand:+ start:46 stop:345 length:300 start_codon:yes stop_codon:yes gene_type:complete
MNYYLTVDVMIPCHNVGHIVEKCVSLDDPTDNLDCAIVVLIPHSSTIYCFEGIFIYVEYYLIHNEIELALYQRVNKQLKEYIKKIPVTKNGRFYSKCLL